MIRREVVLSPEARADLGTIYDWIAEAASPEIALAFVERLEIHVRGFEMASERGTVRDDIRPGLRIAGFGRRVSIAFTVDDDRVLILRFCYKGRNWEVSLAD